MYSLFKQVNLRHNFDYFPLDSAKAEIRLLVLYGSHPTAPRRGEAELRVVSLTATPIYEALSYQWGTSPAEQSIIINAQHKAITPSLALALRSLRREVSERVLWVDAICINQSSHQEKSSQVQMMNLIYAAASEVVIWLGRPTASIHGWEVSDVEQQAIRTIKRIYVPPSGQSSRANPPLTPIPPPPVKQSWKVDDLRGIASLCKRDYWSRIWIIQEIGLARRPIIYCSYEGGSEPGLDDEVVSVSGDEFFSGVQKAVNFRFSDDVALKDWKVKEVIAEIANSVPIQLGQRKAASTGPSIIPLPTLSFLLEITQNSKSQKREDRVFGLLGLASDCDGKLVADYSLLVDEVYSSVMELYSSKSQNHKFPAAELVRLSGILQRNLGLERRNWWISSPPGDHVVRIPALLTGTISGLCQAQYKNNEQFSSPGPLIEQHIADRLHGTTLQNAVNGIELLDLESLLQPVQLSRIRIDQRSNLMMHKEGYSQATEKHDTSVALLDRVVGGGSMKFFVTDSWKLGIARVAAEEGDVICQFLGTDVSLILRRTGTTYRALGRAMVWSVTGTPTSTRLESVSRGLSTFPRPLEFEIWGGPMEVWCRMDLETLRRLSS